MIHFLNLSGFWINCKGQPGHGSQFLKNTAGEKINKVISKFLEFRSSEEDRLNNDPNLNLGDVTSVNITMVKVKSGKFRLNLS